METSTHQPQSTAPTRTTGWSGRDPLSIVAVLVGALFLAAVAAIGIAGAADGEPRVGATSDQSGASAPTGDQSTATTSATGILAAIATATDAHAGVPVSVEAKRDAWLVELEEADGRETTVRVEGDKAKVTKAETDDDAGQTSGLDRASVEAALAAALAKASGTVVGVSADDDSVGDTYSVDVQTGGRGDVTEVELNGDFQVTKAESDLNDD